MATKAISHPLPAGASFPPGWTDDFAQQASDALLRGYTVFSKADARTAAQLLLLDGPAAGQAGAGLRRSRPTGHHPADALEPLLADGRPTAGLWGWCSKKT
jgi:hypothetical protein